MTSSLSTLSGLVDRRADATPEAGAFVFLSRGGEVRSRLTFADLRRRADALAAYLRGKRVEPGDRVLIACSDPSDFVPAFFATLRAGAIAVPTPAPRARQKRRFDLIIEDCRPRAVFIGAAEGKVAMEGWAGREDRPILVDPQTDCADDGRPAMSVTATAFLQYTSGSTGEPRGVVVTHAAALANLEMIRVAFGHDDESRFVGWLPLFHDMGLVGNVLQPFYLGTESVLMPPVAFLEDPMRWLAAISHFGARTSGGPDFAYRACVQAASQAPADLDLSRWRVAFNGAEPVRSSTLEAFSAAFALHGFRREAFLPCYGLAEATLLATGKLRADGPRELSLLREALRENRAVPAAGDDPDGHRVTGSGPAPAGQTVAIIDPVSAAALPDGAVGEICIAGPNIAADYWGGPPLPRIAPGGGSEAALRTGDLGFIIDGELYVVGRLKDLLIVEGRNLHPHDIEDAACCATPIARRGRSCVFALDPTLHGSMGAEDREHIVLVQEVERRSSGAELAQAVADIRSALADQFDLVPDALLLVRRGEIDLTTSGKVRRGLMRERFLSGDVSFLREWRRDDAADSLAAPLAAFHAMTGTTADPDCVAATLLDLCAAMTGQPCGDRTATFGEVGMSSLLTMRLIALIEQATSIALPFSLAYGTARLDELAVHLSARLREAGSWIAAPTELLAVEEEGAIPLDPPEQALWAARRRDGDRALILGFTVETPESESIRLLEAVTRVAARHPALMSAYVESLQGVVKTPLERLAPLLSGPLEDILAAPFDLGHGPLRLAQSPGGPGRVRTVLLVHHLAADFRAMTRLAHQIAEAHGKPDSRLPAVGRPRRPRQRAQVDLDFWRAALDGLGCQPVAADFPTRRSGTTATAVPIRLDAADLDKLRQAAGTTGFILLLGALVGALHQATGETDFAALVPFQWDAPGAGGDEIGYQVTPLPVRIMLDPAASCRTLLAALSQAVAEAISHDTATLQEIAADRLASGAPPLPLFDLMAVHLESSDERFPSLALGSEPRTLVHHGLTFGNDVARLRRTEAPIELVVVSGVRGLSAELRLDGRFAAETAALLARRIEEWLRAAARQPDRILPAAETVSDSEQNALDGWGRGRPGEEHQETLTTLIERWAAVAPQAVALRYDGSEISYGELLRRADRIRRQIMTASGGRAPARIGLLIDSPPTGVCAMIGALVVGAAIVPLPTDLPAGRLDMLLRAGAVELLMTDRPERPAASFGIAPEIQVLGLEAPDGWTGPPSRLDPSQPAYLVFTSGSTGLPKGILQSHGALARFVLWQAEDLDIRPGSRMAQIAAAGFDVSLCEIFGALCVGATLCLPERRRDLSPDRLFAWFERDGITVAQATPSLLSGASSADRILPRGLRVLASVGEPLPPALAARLLAGGTGMRLFNLYGPSETIAATFHEVGPGDLAHDRMPVGRPLAGRNVSVRGLGGALLPIGRTGEIYIETADMPSAYAFGPKEAQSRFERTTNGGAGLFRTGDLGRWRSDGVLEILGRADNQIKINGVRIELEAIEAILLGAPGVTRCVVAPIETADGHAVLGAMAVTAPETGVQALRRHCAAHLPHSQMPALFLLVDTLPALPNGKLDRSTAARSLRESFRPGENRGISRSLTPAEAIIAGLWRETLGEAEIGPDSNFFELGGHSILAMQMLNRVQEQLGVALPLGGFFAEPTLAWLADQIPQQPIYAG